MSEENQNGKVTSVEKSDNVKAKDPRKVELGKRLAKISKEAKERKAKQREQSEREQSEREQSERKQSELEQLGVREVGYKINDYVDLRYLVGGVTIVAALGGLYYVYKNDKIQMKLFERNKRRELSEHNESSDLEREQENTKCKPPNTLPSTKMTCIENL